MTRLALHWLALHGKETLETLALILGLLFTAVSFRAEAKERRVSNLMALAGGHRDLWLQLNERPELARILSPVADLRKKAVTAVERRFVHLLITHLAVSYAALRAGVVPRISGLEDDVKAFFSLPIPKQVWQWSRQFQDPQFIAFVERCVEREAKA